MNFLAERFVDHLGEHFVGSSAVNAHRKQTVVEIIDVYGCADGDYPAHARGYLCDKLAHYGVVHIYAVEFEQGAVAVDLDDEHVDVPPGQVGVLNLASEHRHCFCADGGVERFLGANDKDHYCHYGDGKREHFKQVVWVDILHDYRQNRVGVDAQEGEYASPVQRAAVLFEVVKREQRVDSADNVGQQDIVAALVFAVDDAEDRVRPGVCDYRRGVDEKRRAEDDPIELAFCDEAVPGSCFESHKGKVARQDRRVQKKEEIRAALAQNAPCLRAQGGKRRGREHICNGGEKDYQHEGCEHSVHLADVQLAHEY